MNWGGFAGGFSQGFNNGVNIGRTVGDAVKQKKLDDIRTKGLEEAKGMQDSAVADLIKETDLPGLPASKATGSQPGQVEVSKVDQTGAGGPQQAVVPQQASQPQQAGLAGASAQSRAFTVGEKQFGTREEAETYARTKAPSINDLMYKTIFPKMQEELIAQGRIEDADRIAQRMESKRGKDAVETYGKAMTKLMFQNDVDGGIKALGDYYNKFIDDGVDFTGGQVTPDGNFAITTRNKDTGAENTMVMSRGQILRMGMAYNPAELFKNELDQTQAAEKMSAERRLEIDKEDRGEARDNRKASRDQGYALEKLSISEQLKQAGASTKVQQEVGVKVNALRQAGYSETFINEVLPGIIGVGDYKKKTSPEEARRMIYQERMKDTFNFAQKPPEEQQAILDRDMEIVYGKPEAQNPAAQGVPAQPSKGTPYLDPATGKTLYR